MDSKNIPSAHKAVDAERHKFKQSGNVNDEVLVNLSHLVTSLNDDNESKDFKPLIGFFQKDYVAQAVQTWSYYAQVNNHPKLIEATIVLTRTLAVLESDISVSEYGGILIKLILNNYVRVLYRGLNNFRASLTIPMIRLMKEMVTFKSGKYVEEFTSSFDFSLHSLPRILTVTKNDITSFSVKNKHHRLYIRFAFIEFWLALISFCPPLLRKDVISQNFKIMSAWFKQMDKADTAEIMELTLDVLSEKILKEKAFKRMTKTQILNELALSKIYSFFYSSNEKLVKKVNQFLLTYGADPETSVAFPHNFLWLQDCPANGTNKGVTITVNQKEFRVYNKLLFNVLKNFKPWESDMQASTVIKILDHVPELLPPYCQFLASHGSHDPKMTSYWFGCTMLLGRIIRLEIPAGFEKAQSGAIPSLDLVMQSVIPAPLTKVSLTKSLQHEKLIIRQLTCQLLIFSFQKLQKILELYDRKGFNFVSATLRNSFYQNIPEVSIITSAMNHSYVVAKSNKIIQLSLTVLLKHYSATFPNFFQTNLSSSNIFVDIMRKDDFSGIELAIVDNFLQFQKLNGIQTKWWNASAREYSLFTSLLKMASSKNTSSAISERIHQLLKGMFHGTVAFNSILCSPQRALLHSLRALSHRPSNDAELIKIWKLLDETISRCMRTPYRYVDISKEYEKVSPFLVVLTEQWKFLDKESSFDLPAKWICIFLRTMAISGESIAGVKKLARDTLVDISQEYTDIYLSFENYEDKTKKLFSGDSYILSTLQGASFFEHITIIPYHKIVKVTRYPVNDLDATGIIWRLQALVNDNEINLNYLFKDAVDLLLAKLANYLMSNPAFDFMNPKYIQFLLPEAADDQKSFFTVHALIQVYHELKLENLAFEKFALQWLKNHSSLLESSDSNALKFVSAIFGVLNPKDTLDLLQNHRYAHTTLLESVLWKILRGSNFSVPYQTFKNLKEPFPTLDDLLSQFIQQGRIEEFDSSDFIPFALENFTLSFNSFLRSRWFSLNALLPYLSQITKNDVAVSVALTVYENSDVALVRAFVEDVLDHCYQGISRQTLSPQGLKLLCLTSEMLSEGQKKNILEYITSEYQAKYTSPVVKFVIIAGNFDMESVIAWLNKSILHCTKYFSHELQASNDLLEFLSELENLMNILDIWSKVNHRYLQAQLEVILNGSWVSNPSILQYATHIVLKGKGKEVQCGKMLQCLLNNEGNALNLEDSDRYLRFITASIILSLYLMDPQQNSNRAVQSRLLHFYSGTISCEDRIILKILEKIETNTSVSWTDELCHLDFLEGEEHSLMESSSNRKIIVHDSQGIFVTIDKNVILNTLNNYVLGKPAIPSKITWTDLLSFYKENDQLLQSTNGIVYDITFLMLLSVQNGAGLVTHSVLSDGSTEYTFELQRFLSSGMFQILLVALADEETQTIALRLLFGILHSLEENKQFKYGEIFGILLKKIIYTFEIAKQNGEPVNITPCVWLSVSRLSELLTNPGTALHEKAYRWVLSSPFILANDFPLLQELTTPYERENDQENYYRQLAWVLECLKSGTKSSEDVQFLRNKKVFEWLFNLRNLPYLNDRLCTMIDYIFYKVERLEDGGSMLLTRFASTSTLEIQRLSLHRGIENVSNILMENEKEKRVLKRKIVLEAHQLNVDELLQSQAEIIRSQKRTRNWLGEDTENLIKRAHV